MKNTHFYVGHSVDLSLKVLEIEELLSRLSRVPRSQQYRCQEKHAKLSCTVYARYSQRLRVQMTLGIHGMLHKGSHANGNKTKIVKCAVNISHSSPSEWCKGWELDSLLRFFILPTEQFMEGS